mmetsp:Transcript_9710/g.22367  ORF Transcript_9710/g.22367 Transcript_9710/m.22367 type:complete len:248 (-) Transcript_9710:135-878(-)
MTNQSMGCLKRTSQPLVRKCCRYLSNMQMFLVLEGHKTRCQNSIHNNPPGLCEGSITASTHNRLDAVNICQFKSITAKNQPVSNLNTRCRDSTISLHKHHVITRDLKRTMQERVREEELKIVGFGDIIDMPKTVHRFVLVVANHDRVTNVEILHADCSLPLDFHRIATGETNRKTRCCGGRGGWSRCGCKQWTFGRIRYQATSDIGWCPSCEFNGVRQSFPNDCCEELTRQGVVDGVDEIVGDLDIW